MTRQKIGSLKTRAVNKHRRLCANIVILTPSTKRINLPPNMCFDPSDESIKAIEAILGDSSVEVQ